MKTIATIVGARPQFVKAAVVSREIRKRDDVREILIHTGQHYDPNMSDVFFREMKIQRPDYHLNVGSGPHGVQTARMLEGIEEVLVRETPDWVLVYGDTNSTISGALAAAKLQIPVAHVEAGLRSFNRAMPEEVNRVVTDHLSALLFSPTDVASSNLTAEGIIGDKVVRSGDVMYDAALFYAQQQQEQGEVLKRMELSPKSYCLATVHRPANTDEPARLAAVAASLEQVGNELPVVWPVHPRTRGLMEKWGIRVNPNTVRLSEPVGYLDMIRLEQNAAAIITDSGGVQKEAFFFQVPCITIRQETEWVELVHHGFNRLCADVPSGLLKAVREALSSTPDWTMQLYGDGRSAELIVGELASRRVEV